MKSNYIHPNKTHLEKIRTICYERQDGFCGTCYKHNDEHKLELHHRHYKNFGHENQEDMILLCKSCHDAITSSIRFERDYKNNKLEVNIHKSLRKITTKKRRQNGIESDKICEIYISRNKSNPITQWTGRKSNESLFKSNERNYRKKEKN
jgi:hypothetical protein